MPRLHSTIVPRHSSHANASCTPQIPVVLCHGYGMGVGGWHLNLGELTASAHVLAKDWLGCGLSSRPRWEIEGVEETETFFVESLERCVYIWD